MARHARVYASPLRPTAQKSIAAVHGGSVGDAFLLGNRAGWVSGDNQNGGITVHLLDWLAANGLAPLDWQANLEAELLSARFKQHLAATGLEERFEEQKQRFARVRLTRLVIADEGLARY